MSNNTLSSSSPAIDSDISIEENGTASSEMSFETGDFTDWTVLGNTNIETADFGLNPTDGNYQALLTSGNGSVSDLQLEGSIGLNSGELDKLINRDSLINQDAIEGSAIEREITVEKGDTLEFDWNFLTNEEFKAYYNDFAFVYISDAPDSLIKLADTHHKTINLSDSEFSRETGFATFSHQFTNSGTFTIAVGVLDTVDDLVDSALLVDNFSIKQMVDNSSIKQTSIFQDI